MKTVIGVILSLACVGVCIWQVIGIISDIRAKRKLKKEHPKEQKDDEE